MNDGYLKQRRQKMQDAQCDQGLREKYSRLKQSLMRELRAKRNCRYENQGLRKQLQDACRGQLREALVTREYGHQGGREKMQAPYGTNGGRCKRQRVQKRDAYVNKGCRAKMRDSY